MSPAGQSADARPHVSDAMRACVRVGSWWYGNPDGSARLLLWKGSPLPGATRPVAALCRGKKPAQSGPRLRNLLRVRRGREADFDVPGMSGDGPVCRRLPSLSGDRRLPATRPDLLYLFRAEDRTGPALSTLQGNRRIPTCDERCLCPVSGHGSVPGRLSPVLGEGDIHGHVSQVRCDRVASVLNDPSRVSKLRAPRTLALL